MLQSFSLHMMCIIGLLSNTLMQIGVHCPFVYSLCGRRLHVYAVDASSSHRVHVHRVRGCRLSLLLEQRSRHQFDNRWSQSAGGLAVAEHVATLGSRGSSVIHTTAHDCPMDDGITILLPTLRAPLRSNPKDIAVQLPGAASAGHAASAAFNNRTFPGVCRHPAAQPIQNGAVELIHANHAAALQRLSPCT